MSHEARARLHEVVCDRIGLGIADLERRTGFHIKDRRIPESMTFLAWCEKLGAEGLKVDGKHFNLERRPALRHVYSMIPTTLAAARKRTIVIMKGSQVGMTIWEMLANLYMALKFEPLSIGMYVPDMSLAANKSSYRFMRFVRTVPDAYERMVGAENLRDGRAPLTKEGNKLTRVLGDSQILFLWTSGKVSTESYPLDVVSFDEVQVILIEQIEKITERLSGSDVGLRLLLSTANWPEADIDYWYRLGTRERFHTRCACPDGVVLDEVFPSCIEYNEGQVKGAPTGEYVYVCPSCRTYIADSQAPADIPGCSDGWVAENPDAEIRSAHVPQTLSATVSARDIIRAFHDARDLKNFYNRKLGKPWADPSQIPINDAVLSACVRAGAEAGSKWLDGGRDFYMGIDQMGAFNVVEIKRRAPDGRRETVHLEMIFAADPFARCSTLMERYGIAVCVVETLPNYNDAKRFANQRKHRGRVFLANYADMKDDMIRWGDVNVTRADRRTVMADRDRYTVTLDQYKCMSTSMAYFTSGQHLIPDPEALVQEVMDKGVPRRSAICREYFFRHLKKTALVTQQDPEQRKMRRKVVKVGIDPHFAYANMLCDVAFARSHGTATFHIPHDVEEENPMHTGRLKKDAPGLPADVVSMMETTPAGDVCGRCTSFDAVTRHCRARNFRVRATDPACPVFTPDED